MSQNAKQGLLFPEEELYDHPHNLSSSTEIQNTEQESIQDKPVTVLGMTFPNDDVRREYFREELRKKLPELRKIEGFPIGEDDDIINLSDPPYYTACPNPWLNDFVKQWEEEKVQLEAKGERSKDFDVKEPYASDVSEGKNNPIYNAHAYHTKVPHPAIMRYILHYTQPGDIIFDGFAGTGMTGVAAQMCGSSNEVEKLKEKDIKVGIRHAICSDLSPIASLIAATYNLKFDAKRFKREAERILTQVDKELGHLFTTEIEGKKATINSTIWSDVFTCPSCGREIVLWNESVDLSNEKMRDKFPCPHCGTDCSKKSMAKVWETSYDPLLNETVRMNKKIPIRVSYTLNGKRGEKDVTSKDIDIATNVETTYLSACPIVRMPEGDESRRNDRNGITHVHQFYTWRNLLYIARVMELAKGDVFLTNWITSAMLSTTKMNKFRFTGTGITSGTLYISSINWEFVPANTLQRKLKSFMQLAYEERGSSVISINSATSLTNLEDDSIDYIFTDPPFGANIMYSELSSIWEAWLKVMTNTKEEAIINNVQQKTIFEYQRLMNASFREYYRVLKPGKWLTVEFSNTSASVWNSIQNALQGVGFVVANVAALDKKQGSFKAVTTTTAVKQDLVLTCFKPSAKFTVMLANKGVNANTWTFIEEFLQHLPVHVEKEHKTTAVIERSPKILYDRLISYFVQHGLPVPMDAQAFQQGLRERFLERDGMFFTATQAAEYDEKKKTATEFVPMGIIVSSEADGIAWLKNELWETPKTYQELQPEWMQAINGVRKGDVLPELSQILDENFIEEADGKWRLPDIQDDVDKAALRNKALLREFKIYVETAKKPKGRIKEARVEALRAGFKQCYIDKDFATIVLVGDRIPQNLRDEDEVLLQFYDIALNKV